MNYFISYFTTMGNGAFSMGNCVMACSREIKTDKDLAQLQDSILQTVNTDGQVTGLTIINYKKM